MLTADHCRAMADEADRLAAVVSYGRDKVRLKDQAASWRAKADALDAQPVATADAAHSGSMFGWLRRRCA